MSDKIILVEYVGTKSGLTVPGVGRFRKGESIRIPAEQLEQLGPDFREVTKTSKSTKRPKDGE